MFTAVHVYKYVVIVGFAQHGGQVCETFIW